MPINLNHTNNEITTDDSNLTFAMTGALVLPTGNTSTRPTGETGMVRFNTTNSVLEGFDGSNWENIQYTSADFDSDFSGKSTTDLAEGTNLYYTDARANSAIDTRVNKAFVDALNVDADTLDGLDSTAFDPVDTGLVMAIALG